MKKTLVSILVSLVVVLSMTTVARAATADEVISYLRAKGGSNVSSSEIVELERFFKENPITAEEGDQLKAKIDEAKAIADAEGTTDLSQLSSEAKNQLKSVLASAGAIIDVEVAFNGDRVNFYKDGKLVASASATENGISFSSNGRRKLAYTGNEISVVAVSAVAIIALATGTILVGKRVRNA